MSAAPRHIALIGLGLIASSMAHALRRLPDAPRLTGFDASASVRDEARVLGFCEVCDDIESAVRDADIIVLAVPVGAMGAVTRDMAGALKPGAIVTETGSVKRAVIDAILPHLPAHAAFVPGHPIAGTEYSGPGAGFATLFVNRYIILTPEPHTPPAAVTAVREMWQSMGAMVEDMDPDHHDLVLAVTSHIPHLIAYTMVGVADDLERVTDREVIRYSASGFRDFTRIAASDPVMWRDVFLNNRDASLDILGRFTEELFALQRLIRMGDGAALEKYFEHTRAIRRGILAIGQDVAAPDFGRVDQQEPPA